MQLRANRKGKYVLIDEATKLKVAFDYPVDANEALTLLDKNGKPRYSLPPETIPLPKSKRPKRQIIEEDDLPGDEADVPDEPDEPEAEEISRTVTKSTKKKAGKAKAKPGKAKTGAELEEEQASESDEPNEG
jgi:hypothetical protein